MNPAATVERDPYTSRNPFEEPIDNRPDLKDPKVLLTRVDQFIEGMAAQAQASQSNSAMQGHPYPSALFSECVEVLRACRLLVVDKIPKEEPKKPEPKPKAVPAG